MKKVLTDIMLQWLMVLKTVTSIKPELMNVIKNDVDHLSWILVSQNASHFTTSKAST